MLKLSRLEVKKIGFISCIFRNCNSHICSQLRSYIRPHKDLKMVKKIDKIPDKQTLQDDDEIRSLSPHGFNGGVCVCPELNFAK